MQISSRISYRGGTLSGIDLLSDDYQKIMLTQHEDIRRYTKLPTPLQGRTPELDAVARAFPDSPSHRSFPTTEMT